MPTAKCSEVTEDPLIVLYDKNKQKACFRNPKRSKHTKHRVDGCMICDAVAADWVLSKSNCGDLIVELKGKNVEHGAKQIFQTAVYWTERKLRTGKLAGLIVARQYPRASTTIQRKQNEFAKKFFGPLRVVTSFKELDFESMLEFPKIRS
jgi:hypothetical protein